MEGAYDSDYSVSSDYLSDDDLAELSRLHLAGARRTATAAAVAHSPSAEAGASSEVAADSNGADVKADTTTSNNSAVPLQVRLPSGYGYDSSDDDNEATDTGAVADAQDPSDFKFNLSVDGMYLYILLPHLAHLSLHLLVV
jgi:hypothetical protein